MRYLLTLVVLVIVIAGCSPRPAVTQSTKVSPNNRGIANIAPEGRLTETSPGGTGSFQTDATAIPLTAIQGNAPAATNSVSTANWQTFTDAALGVTVNYPSDWSAAEGTDGATFTSPKGATIQLEKAAAEMKNKEFKIGNQQCTSRTNEHGLTADICADNASLTYTANFTLQKTDGSIQRVMLMTKTRTVGKIFEAMFNSLQPVN